MAYIGCPSCGKTMKDDGTPCPHCAGSGVVSGPSHRGKLLIGLSALLLAPLVIGAIFSGSGDDASRAAALTMCRQYVRERLKAPSTATFAGIGESTVNEYSGQEWGVRSHVDAQNGFGAMLRSTFDCTVKFEGDGQWRLVDLKID